MLDTHTCDLLAAAEEALHPPAHLPPRLAGRWHSRTLRHRLPLVREALRIAHQDGDLELATYLIDQAITDHPTASTSWGAAARTWARTRLRPRDNPRHHPLAAWLESRSRRWTR
ncbi:hypothetical protein ACWFMI_24440 [Nocardiopsis terrae]